MSTPQAVWWLGVQTGLALLRVIIWIWDTKFDNYDDFRGRDIPVYNQTHFQGQELAALLFSMSDEYAKHYDLDMPVSLLERLKEQSIYFFLKQAQEIVNGQDLPQNLRNGLFNGCTAVWDFPEPLFPKWLGYRSGNFMRQSDKWHVISNLVVVVRVMINAASISPRRFQLNEK